MVRDERGDRRARDTWHDPRRREDREHPRPERIGIDATDHDVRDGRYRARAESLDRARRHQHRHRRREAPDQKTDGKEGETGPEWRRGTEAVRELAGDDNPDEGGEKKCAEDPPIKCDSAEVIGDERHDRRDRERFERDEGHVENEAHGEPAPAVVH